jgi:hypothetical protein
MRRHAAPDSRAIVDSTAVAASAAVVAAAVATGEDTARADVVTAAVWSPVHDWTER